MANKQINDYTIKGSPEVDDHLLIQEVGGTTLRVALGSLHKAKVGFYNYDNTLVAQTITADGSWQKLNNNKLGPLNITTYRPSSMDEAGIWDAITNQFDFSQLSLGDEVQMRIDLDVTPGSNNQDIDVRLLFDIGGTEISLMVDHMIQKGTSPVLNHISYVRMFMGSAGVLSNPGEIQVRVDSGTDITVNVHGWYTSLIRR